MSEDITYIVEKSPDEIKIAAIEAYVKAGFLEAGDPNGLLKNAVLYTYYEDGNPVSPEKVSIMVQEPVDDTPPRIFYFAGELGVKKDARQRVRNMMITAGNIALQNGWPIEEKNIQVIWTFPTSSNEGIEHGDISLLDLFRAGLGTTLSNSIARACMVKNPSIGRGFVQEFASQVIKTAAKLSKTDSYEVRTLEQAVEILNLPPVNWEIEEKNRMIEHERRKEERRIRDEERERRKKNQ